MAEPKYVTCGGAQHTFLVLPDSEADKKYEKNQYIPENECPECLDGYREYFRRHAQSCECQEDLCCQGKGCAYAQDLASVPNDIPGLQYL